MEQTEWKIHFCWVKTHIGILGNELADTLAKDAATNLDIAECYNKVPKSVVKRKLEDRSVEEWQRDWNQSTKGKITKDFSDSGRKTENENNDHPKLHNHGHGTWEHRHICTVLKYLKHQHANAAIRTKQQIICYTNVNY